MREGAGDCMPAHASPALSSESLSPYPIVLFHWSVALSLSISITLVVILVVVVFECVCVCVCVCLCLFVRLFDCLIV